MAIVLMVLNLTAKQYYYAELFLDDEWVASHALYERAFFAMLICFIVRCQYYCAWKLVEAAVIVTGLGFNGYDSNGKPQWCVSQTTSGTVRGDADG
jgi:hypothetical protein